MPDLFKDWLPSINEKTRNLFHENGVDSESLEKEYPSFMINRALSMTQDTILQANMVNVRANFLTPEMQYDFLYASISKKKRWGTWAKATKDDVINIIKKTYGYSQKKAETTAMLLSEKDIEKLVEYNFEGGKK